MFGATPRCPTCEKLVYAAEQIVGPGRKFYHKPCLTCTLCRRRLDSYTLLEHDEQPFCKPCHLKSFGTRDLRHANLPYAPAPDDASPPSPTRPAPIDTSNDLPRLRPTRVLSPTSSNFPRPLSRPGSSHGYTPSAPPHRATSIPEEDAPADADADTSLESSAESYSASTDPTSIDEHDDLAVASSSPSPSPAKTVLPTNTGRPGLGNLPRTVPLSFDYSTHVVPSPQRTHKYTQSLGSLTNNHRPPSPSSSPPPSSTTAPNPLSAYTSPLRYSPTGRIGMGAPAAVAALTLLQQEGGGVGFSTPLRQTPTGTRYGAALGGGVGVNVTGSATRRWGGTATPQCPRCSKSVYFAEQVKAAGKTYHKYCLRCTECSTSLDSTRLRDHDEQPFCVRCYNKLHGPQGQGYALLGKAGG